MDNQGQLTEACLVVTLWAPGEPHVLIGVKKEAITRRLFTKLFGFLFLLCHGDVAILGKK